MVLLSSLIANGLIIHRVLYFKYIVTFSEVSTSTQCEYDKLSVNIRKKYDRPSVSYSEYDRLSVNATD